MENTLLIILIAALFVLNAVLLFVVMRGKKEKKDPAEGQSMSMMNQNLQGMQSRLDQVSVGINERLDNAARVIGEVNKGLGSMQEIGRNMQSLQDFLKSPKLRGNIGEQVLREMLGQYFPSHLYQMQYKFKDGQMVDAILRTEGGIIPIDAKFPMENFQKMVREESEESRVPFQRAFVKDVKKHISDIAKKYILPDEETVDFAIMYIPSEAVYYEIVRDDIELNAYGIEKKVLFVSPNSFYYFLRVLMTARQEQQMASAAKEMYGVIKGIQKDAERFGETLGVLGRHITNARSALDRTESDFVKMAGKIHQIDKIEEEQLLEDSVTPSTE